MPTQRTSAKRSPSPIRAFSGSRIVSRNLMVPVDSILSIVYHRDTRCKDAEAQHRGLLLGPNNDSPGWIGYWSGLDFSVQHLSFWKGVRSSNGSTMSN
jgi:hypothetical protein